MQGGSAVVFVPIVDVGRYALGHFPCVEHLVDGLVILFRDSFDEAAVGEMLDLVPFYPGHLLIILNY